MLLEVSKAAVMEKFDLEYQDETEILALLKFSNY